MSDAIQCPGCDGAGCDICHGTGSLAVRAQTPPAPTAPNAPFHLNTRGCANPPSPELLAAVQEAANLISAPPFDYPAAARSIALNLSAFCDESQPYPKMIADAARKASKALDEAEAWDVELRTQLATERAAHEESFATATKLAADFMTVTEAHEALLAALNDKQLVLDIERTRGLAVVATYLPEDRQYLRALSGRLAVLRASLPSSSTVSNQ